MDDRLGLSYSNKDIEHCWVDDDDNNMHAGGVRWDGYRWWTFGTERRVDWELLAQGARHVTVGKKTVTMFWKFDLWSQ